MADPDLEMGGGGRVIQTLRWGGRGGRVFGPHFGLKIRWGGGPGPEGPSPGSTTEIRGRYNYVAHTLTHFGTFPTDVL